MFGLTKQAMGQIWPVGHGADLGADLCGFPALASGSACFCNLLKIHPSPVVYATLKSLFTFTYPVKLKNILLVCIVETI